MDGRASSPGTDLLWPGGRLLGGPFVMERRTALERDFICAICHRSSGSSPQERPSRGVEDRLRERFHLRDLKTTGAGADLLRTGARFLGGRFAMDGRASSRRTDLLRTDGRLLGGRFVMERREAPEHDFICAICHRSSGSSPQERPSRGGRGSASRAISFARFENHRGRGRICYGRARVFSAGDSRWTAELRGSARSRRSRRGFQIAQMKSTSEPLLLRTTIPLQGKHARSVDGNSRK